MLFGVVDCGSCRFSMSLTLLLIHHRKLDLVTHLYFLCEGINEFMALCFPLAPPPVSEHVQTGML